MRQGWTFHVCTDRSRRRFLQDAAGTTTALVGMLLGVNPAPAWGDPARRDLDVHAAAGTEGLDPALATAYQLAEGQARSEGVTLWITSGFRTWAEQDQLWRDAIVQYGSPEAARRWVLPPQESSHVTGHAIDVGPQPGADWLHANGNRWGLCRMYENEWWHFELATLPGEPPPSMLPDASDR